MLAQWIGLLLAVALMGSAIPTAAARRTDGPVAAAKVPAQAASRRNEETVETRSVTFRVLGLMKTKSGAT